MRSPERRICPNLCSRALNVPGAADQRHDVADIDAGIRAQRNFSAHPRERAQEYTTRAVANDFNDFLDGSAMELVTVDQYLDHVAGDRTQDLISIDLGTDDGLGRDNGGGRTGNDNVIAILEDRVQVRLDIGASTDNSLHDGSSADLVFDCLNGSARAGRHAIGSRLELAIGQILGLWPVSAGELRLELRRLLL